MEEKKGSNKIVIIVMAAVIVVMAAVVGVMFYKMSTAGKPGDDKEIVNNLPPSGSGVVISEDSRNVGTNIAEKVAKGSVAVKMTQDWIFNNGGESSNAYLTNSERNSYDMRFEITLEDSGEVIMTSPDVPVGSCIENFPLSVKLEPGKYNVVIAHQLVENGEVFATARTAGTITVN